MPEFVPVFAPAPAVVFRRGEAEGSGGMTGTSEA